MTWNACGGNNTSCRFYEDPGGLVAAIVEQMLGHGTPTHAAFIQEFCDSFAKPLERELERRSGYGWDVRFAAAKVKRGADPARAPDTQCDRGRGAYGLAMAVPAGNTSWQVRYLPSPEGEEWRVAMCATLRSWRLRLCNAHLSYGGDDPTGRFRAQQLPAYLSLLWPSPFRVVFGGDLNLRTNSAQIVQAYEAFVECAQANQASPRTGPGTYYYTTPHANERTVKVDYLFTDPGSGHTCAVPPEVVHSSDHRPMWMTVDLSG